MSDFNLDQVREQLRMIRDSSAVNMLDFPAVKRQAALLNYADAYNWMQLLDTYTTGAAASSYMEMMNTLGRPGTYDDSVTIAEPLTLRNLLIEIARNYRGLDDPCTVNCWVMQKRDTITFLACLMDGHNQQIKGSVPWDEQPSWEALERKMWQIYRTYLARKEANNTTPTVTVQVIGHDDAVDRAE